MLGDILGGAAGGATVAILVKAKDEASRTLQTVGNNATDMSAKYRMAGMAMVAVSGAIMGALAQTVKAAAAEEAGISRLTVAMKNVGIEYDSVKGSLEEWINTMQQKTSIADTDQRSSLASLVSMTGDLAEAQDLLTLAMDVSIGTGKDLEAANQMVMYALGGNWGMVERYIPALKQVQEEEKKWAMLRSLFAGQAEAYGQTLEGQWNTLMNNIGDLKEAIGGVLLPAVKPIIEWLKNMVEWLKKVDPVILRMAVITGTLAAALVGLGGVILLVKTSMGGLAGMTGLASTAMTGLAARVGITSMSMTAMIGIVGALALGVGMLVFGIMELIKYQKQYDALVDKKGTALEQHAKWQAAHARGDTAGANKAFKEYAETMIQMEKDYEAYAGEKISYLTEEERQYYNNLGAVQSLDNEIVGAKQDIGAFGQEGVASLNAVTYAAGVAAAAVAGIGAATGGGGSSGGGGFSSGAGGPIGPGEWEAALAGEYGRMKQIQTWAFQVTKDYSVHGEAWGVLTEKQVNQPGMQPFTGKERIPGTDLFAATKWEEGMPLSHTGLGGPPSTNYAEGGIVNQPTLALVGEAGPEAIVPLGKGQGGLQNVIKIYLDSREISARTIEAVEERLSLEGVH